MVNYVCRTCLYVCDNEFSFRKLEKVLPVLEMFVPEVKNCIGKYTLICEQCYYFLKNVEKFKVKCMETQKKLYSMNLETIKNNNNAVLKSFVNETFVTENQIRPNKKSKRDDSDITIASLMKTSIENIFRSTTSTSASNDLIHLLNSHAKDNNKNNNNAALKSSVNQTLVTENQTRPNKKLKRNVSDITIASLLKTSTENTNQSTTSTSASNDLIQSLNSYANDINELKGFREFAAKPSPTQSQQGNVSIIEVIMNYEDVASPEEDNSNKDKENEEDEYMTRKDLVAAGILSDHDSITDSNIELINSEDDQNVYKIGGSNKSIVNTSQAVVKTEVMDNENPGFFNKKSTDGFYKCRLCDKKYKASQGLHRHTKEKHGDEVKFYHCNYCSFFSLWKSALMRHYSVFHGNIFEMNNKSSTVKCHHCSFKTTSKDQLSHHILDTHAYKKFTRCTLCRARFSDEAAFAKHMETEHLPSSTSSRYCLKCTWNFSSDDDYVGHLKEKHGEIVCRTCKKIFGSKGEFHEHRRSVHSTSFGASVLP